MYDPGQRVVQGWRGTLEPRCQEASGRTAESHGEKNYGYPLTQTGFTVYNPETLGCNLLAACNRNIGRRRVARAEGEVTVTLIVL